MAIALIFLNTSMFAQEFSGCAEILQFGIRDIEKRQSDTKKELFVKKVLTESQFSSVSEFRSTAAAIGAILPSGIYNVSGNSEKEKVQQVQRLLREEFELRTSFREVTSVDIQTINRHIVDKWGECRFDDRGIKAWYRDLGDGLYTLNVTWLLDSRSPKPKSKSRINSIRVIPERSMDFDSRLDRMRAKRGFIVRNRQVKKIAFRSTDCRNLDIEVDGDYSVDWLSSSVITCSIQPPPVPCARIEVSVFEQTSGSSSHPSVEVVVPEGYKIIGGGARVGSNPVGNLIVESYPVSTGKWRVKSKDHGQSSQATITAYALAMYDPENRFDVQVFSQTGGAGHHPTAVATVGDGYVMSGGGGKINYSGAGNLMTASFPQSASSWQVSSKDHQFADLSSATAYAIGIKLREECSGTLVNNLTSLYIDRSRSPSGTITIGEDYVLSSGGARIDWGGSAGNFFTYSYPNTLQTWTAGTKDHLIVSTASMLIYALGLKIQ